MIQQKLTQLKNEYDVGTKQLKQLEIRLEELRNTLLRISGAIHVLEELKQAQDSSAQDTAK